MAEWSKALPLTVGSLSPLSGARNLAEAFDKVANDLGLGLSFCWVHLRFPQTFTTDSAAIWQKCKNNRNSQIHIQQPISQ